jgi:hypothetical protein
VAACTGRYLSYKSANSFPIDERLDFVFNPESQNVVVKTGSGSRLKGPLLPSWRLDKRGTRERADDIAVTTISPHT